MKSMPSIPRRRAAPRTAAEIRPGAGWRDVVGMTGMPEAVLARELGALRSDPTSRNHAAGRI